MAVFRGDLRVLNFFVVSLRARNGMPAIKLLAISKMDEVDFFFSIFEGKWGWLNVFRGTCIVANFFTASLCARNCIPRIKLLAISKTAKLEFFFVFLEQIRAVLGLFRGVLRVPNFFVASPRARNCIPAIKLSAISKTAKLEFFSYFWSK